MTISYAYAFARLAPNRPWRCDGSLFDYDNFVSLDGFALPSQAECDAVLPIIEAEEAQAQVRRSRQAAYQAEADPIFFASQRGEATEQDWLDKVADIRARYPYPA